MYAIHHKCEFVNIFLSWGADPTPYLAGIEQFANWQVKEWVNKAMQLRIWEESSRQGSREAFHLSKHNCDTINTAPFDVVGQASSVYAVLRGSTTASKRRIHDRLSDTAIDTIRAKSQQTPPSPTQCP